MAQRQFRSDDTSVWADKFGDGSSDVTKSADETASLANATVTGNATEFTVTLGGASTFANGDIVIIHQTQKATGAGVWELNKIVSGATTTTLTLKYPLMNTYAANAQIVGFVKAKNFTINSGKTVTLPAWDGTASGIYPVLANGDISIAGTILGTGKAFGGGDGSNSGNYSGEGIDGPQVSLGGAHENAGSGGVNVDGGGGANGAAGGNGTSGGVGGSAVGNAGLTLMDFGGGGGGGNAGNGGGDGGVGGGIVLLIGKSITVTGAITVGGTDGTSGGGGRGGGGGAGGSVLLKAKTIVLGTALITTPGGAAGGGGEGTGGIGSVGRIHADYSTSLTGTTTPTIDSTLDTTISEGGSGFFAFL
jgi:large repetitive protein